MSHLREFRKRITWIFVIIILGIAAATPFASDIFSFLAKPVMPYLQANHTQFITLGLMEGWSVYMQAAILGGVLISSPFWLYHIWAFIAPALEQKEKRTVLLTTFFALLCFLGGEAFCYYFIMPVGFQCMIAILGKEIVVMPQMQSYLTLALWLITAFGLVFQLPIVLIHLVRWGVVKLETLKKSRRHMIVIAFIVGAILTPPDVISQLSMSIPLILLYELSLLIARFCEPKLVRAEVETKQEAA